MTSKLEKHLRSSRRRLTQTSLRLFGKGTFDGYRLISDDSTWCLEPIDEFATGIFRLTKILS